MLKYFAIFGKLFFLRDPVRGGSGAATRDRPCRREISEKGGRGRVHGRGDPV